MSLEVTDLEQREEPELFTVWEPAPAEVQEATTPGGGANQTSGQLAARYIQLLDPACRRLAYEVSLREQAVRLPKEKDLWRAPAGRLSGARGKEERENSWIAYSVSLRNFYGVLYTSSAPEFPGHAESFYEKAIEEFEEATRLVGELENRYRERGEDPTVEGIRAVLRAAYLPYENLGNAQSFLGRKRDDPGLQVEALFYYQESLARVGRVPEGPDRVRRRVNANQATAKLLSKDSGLIREAIRDVGQVENDLDPEAERDVALLYAIACWYAVALDLKSSKSANATEPLQGVSDVAKRARYYLIRALGRDQKRDLWNWFVRDEDLQSLGSEFLTDLKLGLTRKLLEVPALAKMPAYNFKWHMQEVLESGAVGPMSELQGLSKPPAASWISQAVIAPAKGWLCRLAGARR